MSINLEDYELLTIFVVSSIVPLITIFISGEIGRGFIAAIELCGDVLAEHAHPSIRRMNCPIESSC